MRALTARLLAFGAFGWLVEYAFTAAIGRPKRPNPAMLPLYGLAGVAFPPLRDALGGAPLAVRGLGYGAAMIVAEYATGRALRAAFGRAPWTYAGKRWSVDDLTRLDYLPLWALYGLALERLDGRLGPRGPGLRAPGAFAPQRWFAGQVKRSGRSDAG